MRLSIFRLLFQLFATLLLTATAVAGVMGLYQADYALPMKLAAGLFLLAVAGYMGFCVWAYLGAKGQS